MEFNTCSKRIQECMDERNWTQTDLYEHLLPICQKYKVTISKSSLSYYLSGKRTPRQDTIKCLADTFGVDVAWLWGFGNTKINNSNDEKRAFRIAQQKEDYFKYETTTNNSDDDFFIMEEDEPKIMVKDMKTILDYASKLAELPEEKRQLVFGMIDNLL